MELLLRNKDYVPDSKGGLVSLTGEQEVLGRVLFRLQARRGAMPFLPETGSLLYLLGREKTSFRQQMALRYVQQALENEAVEVTDVVLSQEKDGRLEVAVYLLWQGQPLSATVTV